MSLPLVSIVIPMYNQQEALLRACLESAINQTYKNIEVIVSDNHSTNGASNILKEYENGRLRIVKPDCHIGIVENFNFASDKATGEYITILSSDDILYPKCVENVLETMLKYDNVSFGYCENAFIDLAGKKVSILRNNNLATGLYEKHSTAMRMFDHTEFWIIGGIIRNECFKKIKFYNEIMAGDWILGLKLLKYGKAVYRNEELSAIRFYERPPDQQKSYEKQKFIHDIQRTKKHSYIIEDEELLNEIGISRSQAKSIHDREILGSVIILVRKYHQKEVSRDTIREIFNVYRSSTSGFSFNLLTRYYRTWLALGYTYLLGLLGRLRKKPARKRL